MSLLSSLAFFFALIGSASQWRLMRVAQNFAINHGMVIISLEMTIFRVLFRQRESRIFL